MAGRFSGTRSSKSSRTMTTVAPAGQAIEVGAGGRRGFANRAEFLRLFERALSPTAGQDVVGALALGLQVHRNHCELQARAALQEEYFVIRSEERRVGKE